MSLLRNDGVVSFARRWKFLAAGRVLLFHRRSCPGTSPSAAGVAVTSGREADVRRALHAEDTVLAATDLADCAIL